MVKKQPPAKIKEKTKNKLSSVGILLFGILSVLIGFIGFTTSHVFIGIIMLLFGLMCIILSVGQLKK